MELGELEDSNDGEDFPQPFSTDPLGQLNIILDNAALTS